MLCFCSVFKSEFRTVSADEIWFCLVTVADAALMIIHVFICPLMTFILLLLAPGLFRACIIVIMSLANGLGNWKCH